MVIMFRWILYGEIFNKFSFSWFPKHVVVALVDSILYPIKPYIRSFGGFFWVMSFNIPSAVKLSVCMGVACCGWPISSSVTLIGSPYLVLWINAPNYASAAYDIAFFMVFDSFRIDPLDSRLLLKLWYPKKNVLPCEF